MRYVKINKVNEWLNLNTNVNLKEGSSINLYKYSFFNLNYHINETNNKIYLVVWMPNPGELETRYDINIILSPGYYTTQNIEGDNDILKIIIREINKHFVNNETFKLEYDPISDRAIITSLYRFLFIDGDDVLDPPCLGLSRYPSPTVYENSEGTFKLITPRIPIIETIRFLNLYVEIDGGLLSSNYIDSNNHYVIDINQDKSKLIYNKDLNIQKLELNRDVTFSKIKVNISSEDNKQINIDNIVIILQLEDQK